MEIKIIKKKNYIIKHRALKIFINDKFVDYLDSDENSKIILTDDNSSELFVKVDWCYSNTVKLGSRNLKNTIQLAVNSQIQNGLFIFIYLCTFGGLVLYLLDIINKNLSIAFASPLLIIVYWQTFGRKKYLRLTKS